MASTHRLSLLQKRSSVDFHAAASRSFFGSNRLTPSYHAALVTLLATMLGGCLGLGSKSQVADTRAIEPTPTVKTIETIDRPFPVDTLYSLMAAELAGKSQQYTLALRNYLHQAKKTRDPKVIKRAMQIARYLKSDEGILEAALLYHEIDPENIEVMQIAALQFAKTGEFDRSFELVEKLLSKDAATQLDFLAAQIITQKEPPIEQFLPKYLKLFDVHPDRKDLLLGTAVFYLASDEPEQAMKLTEQVLNKHPRAFQPNLLKSRILIAQKRFPEALTHIESAVDDTPMDARLRMQFIHLLLNTRDSTDKERFAQNEVKLREQFHRILRQNPRSPAVVINLANISARAGLIDIAELYLKQQIALGYNAAHAHFQLGQFAESVSDWDKALLHYQQVDRGPLLAAAGQQTNILFKQEKFKTGQDLLKQARIEQPDQITKLYQIEIELLAKYKQFGQAIKIADEALGQVKDNPDLLYSRSMLHEQAGNLPLAEADLRKILADNPNDSMALNALGYSLTVHTKRYDEALKLITKALKMKPEEPAIIDSLGWLQYQMGSLKEAQRNLEKAHQKIKDPEVVAHLAEVLWVIGEKDRASQLLFDSLNTRPNSPELLGVIKQFEIPKPQTPSPLPSPHP